MLLQARVDEGGEHAQLRCCAGGLCGVPHLMCSGRSRTTCVGLLLFNVEERSQPAACFITTVGHHFCIHTATSSGA